MVREATTSDLVATPFADRIVSYRQRLERTLHAALPAAQTAPVHLHEVMRQAIFISDTSRAALVYATGEALQVPADLLDAPAAAIELVHGFARLHDTATAGAGSRAEQAVAILAADALQPLAFAVLASADALRAQPELQTRMVAVLAEACGANGLVGGRALHLAIMNPDPALLEHAYRLGNGRLFRAAVMCAAMCCPVATLEQQHALERYSDAVGIASQIRSDILAERRHGSGRSRPTYPALVGLARAGARTEGLAAVALDAIAGFGPHAESLREIARYFALREE
jgi:farnesyl diphosphate synthase